MSETTPQLSYRVRDYLPEDRNFILATFLRGLYYGDSWFSAIPKAIFMENAHRMIEQKLDTPGVHVQVACLSDDPSVILGYSISRCLYGVNVLDWIFVKNSWRRQGIAKTLTPEPLHAVTTLTKMGKALKPAHVIFNPYI